MRSSSVAEWIVSRFIERNRAASIVGDLMEMKPQKGGLWFWLSVLGVTLSLTWRHLLAFCGAVYAGSWAMAAFSMAIYGNHSLHRPPEYPWMPLFVLLSRIGAVLWMVLLYTSIRYGFDDKLTRFALAWTAVVTAIIYFWWQPLLLALCIASGIFVAAASLIGARHRKTSLALWVSVAVGYGVWSLAGYVCFYYQHHVLPGPMGDRELRAHPSIAWMGFCTLLITVWIVSIACKRTHNRLGRDMWFSSDIES